MRNYNFSFTYLEGSTTFTRMKNFLIRLLLYSLAILITAYILPGVTVGDWLDAIILAGVLAVLNYIVKPVLVVITIPITVITLGLFMLVINTVIILIAEWLVSGFDVRNFWWALLFGLIVSLINSVFNNLAKD